MENCNKEFNLKGSKENKVLVTIGDPRRAKSPLRRWGGTEWGVSECKRFCDLFGTFSSMNTDLIEASSPHADQSPVLMRQNIISVGWLAASQVLQPFFSCPGQTLQ